MFARHNKTFRHTVRQYRPGPAGRRKTSQQPINFSKTPRPSEKGLMAALRRLVARYKEIRHAKRLPCQILWDLLFGRKSDSRKPTQGAGNLSGTGTTTISYFLGLHPTKNTKDASLLQERSSEAKAEEGNAEHVQGVEEHVNDVDGVGEDIEGPEECIDNNAEAEAREEEVEGPEDVDEDTKNLDRVGDVEETVEDNEDGEEEDHDHLKNVGENDDDAAEAERVVRSVEEAHNGDKQDEGSVGEDVGKVEDVDGHCEEQEKVEWSAEGDDQELHEEHTDKELSEKSFGDMSPEQSMGSCIHIDDAGIMNANDVIFESGQSQSSEAHAEKGQEATPSMEGKSDNEPVQIAPTVIEKSNLQLMPISEDVRRILSQMATSTHYRPRKIALGTRNFITYVLNPRGIQIDTDELKRESAFEHFKSVEPPPGLNLYDHYRHRHGLRSSTVWINPTADVVQAIHNNYSEMHHSLPNALCEPEWVDDAVKYLLKSEPRSQLQPKPSTPPQWLPVRMREESFRPQEGGVWEMPPIVHEDMPVDPTFNFNVQPDCSYWIWAGGFRPEINDKLTTLASVRFRRSLCPYLTIEVKKDAKNSGKGRQQIATAASTALYNRWKLKERYLRKTGSSFSKARLSDVRHYGLLLAGVRYEVWSLRPHSRMDTSHYSTNSWTGCSMRRIHSGDLDTTSGIKDYINWINEIHCWGNTRHSSDCVRDIEGRLLPQSMALTSTMAQLALAKRGDVRV